MSDLLHSHLTFGMLPEGSCPACDQLRRDLSRSRVAVSALIALS